MSKLVCIVGTDEEVKKLAGMVLGVRSDVDNLEGDFSCFLYVDENAQIGFCMSTTSSRFSGLDSVDDAWMHEHWKGPSSRETETHLVVLAEGVAKEDLKKYTMSNYYEKTGGFAE